MESLSKQKAHIFVDLFKGSDLSKPLKKLHTQICLSFQNSDIFATFAIFWFFPRTFWSLSDQFHSHVCPIWSVSQSCICPVWPVSQSHKFHVAKFTVQYVLSDQFHSQNFPVDHFYRNKDPVWLLSISNILSDHCNVTVWNVCFQWGFKALSGAWATLSPATGGNHWVLSLYSTLHDGITECCHCITHHMMESLTAVIV